MEKYKGRAAPISNVGTYQTKNLINDLAKHFEVSTEELSKIKDKLEKIVGDRDRSELVDFKEFSNVQRITYPFDAILLALSFVEKPRRS